MKKRKTYALPILLTWILYTFGFLLLLEWLYPFANIADGMTLVMVYVLICLLVFILPIRLWLKLLVNGAVLFCFLHLFYITESFLSENWIQYVRYEFLYNIELMLSGLWHEMTPLFRGMLLFTLIWLMSYLIHYWFVETKRVFLFILFTMIYLSVLDTFTPYDASTAIVRTFIISFLALALANFVKELEKESIPFRWNKKLLLRWLFSIAAIILFSALLGYVSPKFDPKWPDPVPFVQGVVDEAAVASKEVQKVGYGDNDAHLGGSFVQDDTPVFRATVQNRHYWRGETKDVYTGKGWENASDADYEQQEDGNITLRTFSEHVETTKQEGTVQFYPESASEKVFYPYGITEVHVESNVELRLDKTAEAITAESGGNAIYLREYQVTYEQPSYSIEQLKNAGEQDPKHIKERYTQLPETLPERVGDLAEEIAAPHETRYEKAKAIEQYFNGNGFVYRTTDVPVPDEDQDYVDQFLFESQVGYCDNFSTSMVILLRTLDIPARWVKGFTSGELIERGDGYRTYEVTNANAHSWVEVYFPEVGWVPFEPTQGFSNFTHVYSETESEENEQEAAQQPEPERAEEREEPDEALEERTQPEQGASKGVSFRFREMLIIAAVLAGVGWYVYISRFKLLAIWHKRRLSQRFDERSFQEAYHFLLKVLKHKGLKKNNDQTLREFARVVDVQYDTNAMSRLTDYVEQMLYKNERIKAPSDEVIQLWEDLINK